MPKRGRITVVRTKKEAAGARSARPAADPFALFDEWYQAAEAAGTLLPDAMALATATRRGAPSVRMVLHRGFIRGGFVFYTNYNSRKAVELVQNPHAAFVFHWPLIERQVRGEGRVEKLSARASTTYFQTRPRESRLSAWASPQSAVIAGRQFLETEFARIAARYSGKEVPCPPFWGGFRIVPQSLEFWQGQPHRLHDRLMFRRTGSRWTTAILGP